MTILYPFQQDGVDLLDQFHGRALLADDMGLGKTVQFLWWLKENRTVRPAVVICPASIKYQWQHEAMAHVGMRAQVLESTDVPRRMRLTDCPLVVVNYDIIHAWLPYLLRLEPRALAIDEAHYVTNPKARRTRVVRRLSRECDHVVAITGTPITSRPKQLWPILNMIQPHLYPAFRPFADRYCAPRFTDFGWDFNGASHLNELHQQLTERLMIRRRKRDVLDQLPPINRHLVLLDLKKRAEYDKADRDFQGWLRSQRKGSLWQKTRIEGLARLATVRQLTAQLKLPAVLSWARDFLAQQGKLILFGWHRAIVTELCQQFGKQAVRVDGSVTGKDRQYAVDKFNQDPRTQLLVGNLQAAGVGWSAQDCGDTSFCEFGWTPALHTQAEARAHGLGRGKQGQVTRAWYLVAQGTLEEKMVKLLHKRQQTLDQALDGGRSVDGFDLYTQLAAQLLKGDSA